MENIITAIPVASKEVNYFRSSTIKIIPEPERATIEQLDSIQIKEPMFAVVEGERNYIYSFSKVFEGIEKELDSIKKAQSILIFFTIVSFIVAVGALTILKFKGNDDFIDMVGFVATFVFVCSVFDLIKKPYRKWIKKLEVKKSYVLNESQAYLRNLDQEVKKPVVVV